MINLISICNNNFTGTVSSSINYLKQFLEDRGHETTCYDYFYNLPNPVFIRPDHVMEMNIIPEFAKMYKNWKKNLPIIHNIELSQIDQIVLKDLFSDLKYMKGNIFGFQVSTVNLGYSIIAAMKIRQMYKDSIIVFGGYHMSLGLENKVAKLLLKSGVIDCAVRDDGSDPMLKIANNDYEEIMSGKFSVDIPHPKYTKNDVIETNPVFPSVSSYGCPFKCFFCASKRDNVFGDLGSFRDHLLHCKDLGFKGTEINDDNLNITLNRAMEIADIMCDVNFDYWTGWVNQKNINNELMEKFQLSNCKVLMVGIECFSPFVAENMGKERIIKDVMNTIDIIVKHEILPCMTLITSMPGETDEEYEFTLKTSLEIRKKYGDKVIFAPTIFQMYPGSDTYNNPEKFGISFEYWDGNILPEFGEIIETIPKTFSVGISNEKIMKRWKQLNEESYSKRIIIPYSKSKQKRKLIR